MTWNETNEMVWIISLFSVSCNLWILLSVLQKCHLSFPPPVFKPFPICFSLFWSGFVSKYILLSLAGKPQFHGDLFSRNFKCPPAWYRYQKYRGFVHRPYLYNNQIARETSKHLSWTSVTNTETYFENGQKFRQLWALLQIILSRSTQNWYFQIFKTLLPCHNIFRLYYVQKSWSISK